ncbi:MAG: DUF3795 domain-containing protein [Methanothrix sp.]|jgi:hypothetical protein|uniref:DUF3795 domain-containing protein n=1 Tax=Methanothrix sp. TaxID=90426 RepID=UPI00247C41B1|nr:DUF3795 domain-containing protein [Methanothrix sp.]
MSDASDESKVRVGPCGIICSACPLGSCAVAESAATLKQHIKNYKIPEWSHFVPEGEELKWDEVDLALNWMAKYARCAGCESGGGPPDCPIRRCAQDRGYDMCSSCDDLESCTKFDWLKEHGSIMKAALKENRCRSKEEYALAMAGRMKI